jgi:ribosome-binding protein aMBF1 (putative translation factor)
MKKATIVGPGWTGVSGSETESEAQDGAFALAAALVEARVHAGLTQAQLAARMGTSQTAIARLESVRGNPSLNTLRRFAEATETRLNISFETGPEQP